MARYLTVQRVTAYEDGIPCEQVHVMYRQHAKDKLTANYSKVIGRTSWCYPISYGKIHLLWRYFKGTRSSYHNRQALWLNVSRGADTEELFDFNYEKFDKEERHKFQRYIKTDMGV